MLQHCMVITRPPEPPDSMIGMIFLHNLNKSGLMLKIRGGECVYCGRVWNGYGDISHLALGIFDAHTQELLSTVCNTCLQQKEEEELGE